MNRKGQIIFCAWTIVVIATIIVILRFLWEFNLLHHQKPFAPVLVVVVAVGGFIWFGVSALLFLWPALKRKRQVPTPLADQIAGGAAEALANVVHAQARELVKDNPSPDP